LNSITLKDFLFLLKKSKILENNQHALKREHVKTKLPIKKCFWWKCWSWENINYQVESKPSKPEI
jgi:hypothetical protein